MALDWTAGLLGAAAGGGSKYSEIKDEQRKWKMDQAAQQADMERKLHFQEVSRQNEFNFQMENAGALESAKAKAAATTQEEIYSDPRQRAMREQMTSEQVSQARQVKQAEEDIRLGTEEKILGLKSDYTQKERDAIFKDIDKAIESQEGVSQEQKEAMKTKARLSALGVKGAESVAVEDFINARKAADSVVKETDIEEIEDFLSSEGIPFKTSAEARKLYTDILSAQYLPRSRQPAQGSGGTARPAGVTPESVAAAIQRSANPQAKLEQLKAEDPEMYNAVQGMMQQGSPQASGEQSPKGKGILGRYQDWHKEYIQSGQIARDQRRNYDAAAAMPQEEGFLRGR